ncbi:imidazole glycerol phosphate synthase subunit HisH [Desulfonema magnum]|uniref:Imidazole glycerol phosphate synthase subunit HisH n=1 Tax=Desulfonema magnum TaxID=45655 RepID=A0A975BL04_9BACT|nr:imidazole glycerol phosphate synthase subunit HisH [Desulfonema magnum]QTA87649.1 Imidazole glycerol phosphate synthase [Desulfonema magnum]
MIAIIDYDAGNLTSVARALSHIGFQCVVTNNIKEIERAERIVFPGVGAAGSAMDSLKRLSLDFAIKKAFADGKPVLGICLGTQIIMGHSQENDTSCLGIINGEVRAFPSEMKAEDGSSLKIPHMGWNRISIRNNHPVLSGVRETDEFYFVHGFYPAPADAAHVIAETDYGISFASVVGFKNIIATQFHLEKSGKPGLALLKNFCEWEPF